MVLLHKLYTVTDHVCVFCGNIKNVNVMHLQQKLSIHSYSFFFLSHQFYAKYSVIILIQYKNSYISQSHL